jgi:hypothetical protein
MYAFPMRATCPTHLILLKFIILIYIWRRVQVMEFIIIQFSLSSSYFISLGSIYSPQHPISNTFSLCSCLNVREQVSQPYKTIGKIMVLYILKKEIVTA